MSGGEIVVCLQWQIPTASMADPGRVGAYGETRLPSGLHGFLAHKLPGAK